MKRINLGVIAVQEVLGNTITITRISKNMIEINRDTETITVFKNEASPYPAYNGYEIGHIDYLVEDEPTKITKFPIEIKSTELVKSIGYLMGVFIITNSLLDAICDLKWEEL